MKTKGRVYFSGWISFMMLSFSVFAEPAQVAGIVEDVKPIENQNFQLSIKSDQGVRQYLLDHRIPIETMTQAKRVQPGARILLPPSPDAPRNVSPYDDLKNQANEMKAPEQALDMPLPEPLPEEVSQAQQEVQNQNPPNEPNEADLAAQMQAGAQEGMSPSGKGGEKTKEPEEAVIPEELSYPVPVPRVLSKATPEDESQIGQTVLRRHEIEEGIRLELEGQGAKEVILSPEDQVIQLLGPNTLLKDMKVRLEVDDSPEGGTIRRIALV